MSALRPLNDEPLSDETDWIVPYRLTDTRTGEPINLYGSRLKVTLRSMIGWDAVADFDTEAGSIVFLGPPRNGVFALLSDAAGRTWRCPRNQPGRMLLRQTLIGDIVRRPAPGDTARIEHADRLALIVQAGTTAA